MRDCYHSDDVLDRYLNHRMLDLAQEILKQQDQDEDRFLGAQGVLLLHGLI